MDRLNKSVSDVESKLQSGEEPISGAQGKGTSEQPYDQGNDNDDAAEGRSTCLCHFGRSAC